MFVNAGAHYVALDFVSVKEVGGDLGVMAAQVRRGIAWVYKNAASFGGDPDRIYIGGHSSGGHLCGVALVTDWQKEFGLPPNIVKGGLCMSGMYEMAPDHHLEMAESLGNPYGPNGRAALALMKLAPT